MPAERATSLCLVQRSPVLFFFKLTLFGLFENVLPVPTALPEILPTSLSFSIPGEPDTPGRNLAIAGPWCQHHADASQMIPRKTFSRHLCETHGRLDESVTDKLAQREKRQCSHVCTQCVQSHRNVRDRSDHGAVGGQGRERMFFDGHVEGFVEPAGSKSSLASMQNSGELKGTRKAHNILSGASSLRNALEIGRTGGGRVEVGHGAVRERWMGWIVKMSPARGSPSRTHFL